METREILEKLYLGQINVKEAEMMINREAEKLVSARVKEMVDKVLDDLGNRNNLTII